MGRSGSTPPLRAAALAVLAACLGLLGSCTDETPAGNGLSDIGVIEGRVTECGLPVPATVTFRDGLSPFSHIEVSVQADSSGWFHAELPLGLYGYFLSIDNVNGPRNIDADTVLVGRAIRRKDLARGRAQVGLSLPAVCEGGYCWLDLDARGIGFSRGAFVTDGALRFDLRLMPPAAYALRLDAGFVMGDVLVHTEANPALAESLRVVTDAVATLTHDFRGDYCSLSGRVTGTPNLRGDRVRISAVTANGRQRGSMTCEDDGTFRLDLITPEPLRLRAGVESIEQWFGGDSFENATVFDLQPGLHLDGINLTGGGLRVSFDGPGDLVRNEASVLVVEENGAEHLINNSSANPLVIENLRPGRVRLQVLGGCVRQRWQMQWYGGGASADEATWLDIVTGQLLDVSLTLATGGAITGTLVSTNNRDLYGMAVALHDLDGHRLCPNTLTMRDGQLDLPGIGDGDYLLGLYLSSTPWWYPGTWARSEAVPVSIVDGGTVSGLVWPLPFPYLKVAP